MEQKNKKLKQNSQINGFNAFVLLQIRMKSEEQKFGIWTANE